VRLVDQVIVVIRPLSTSRLMIHRPPIIFRHSAPERDNENRTLGRQRVMGGRIIKADP